MAEAASFEETVSAAGAHKDASLHLGGHGGPWEIKLIVVTRDGRTSVCVRRDGRETVTAVGTLREGLEIFAAELQAAISQLPAG